MSPHDQQECVSCGAGFALIAIKVDFVLKFQNPLTALRRLTLLLLTSG
jgi:hypothetical protein